MEPVRCDGRERTPPGDAGRSGCGLWRVSQTLNASPAASLEEIAFRKAIIAIQPEYFAWTAEAQERYRLTMPESDRFRAEQSVMQTLFGIRVNSADEADAAFKAFDEERVVRFQSAMLFFSGIGDNQFFLNEFLREGETLLDFETVYDYDCDDFCFQQEFFKKEDSRYVVKPYRGSLYYRWARLRIDGHFFYATLCMAEGYLHGLLETFGREQINALIPHRYVDGKNHGKRRGKGTLFDMKVDAGGKEGELEELEDRYRGYVRERCEAVADQFDTEARGRVYWIDKSQTHDPQIDFVFTDKAALRQVRFRHFMADCRNLVGNTPDFNALVDRERGAAQEFLKHHHCHILETFDPKIKKFRKKWKIVIADGALDDL